MYVCLVVLFLVLFFSGVCVITRGRGGVKGGGPEGYNMNGEHFSALFARE